MHISSIVDIGVLLREIPWMHIMHWVLYLLTGSSVVMMALTTGVTMGKGREVPGYRWWDIAIWLIIHECLAGIVLGPMVN